MAHLAELGALTEELITLITSLSPISDPARFNAHRESAMRLFRHNNYARTDQFDVQSRLDGLEEKFRVYNEDPLADALHQRREILAKKDIGWSPEVLYLLLELSDRPVSKARLGDLDFLLEPEPDAGRPLRWKDIAAEEPLLREKSVWTNVDFGAETSDDEDYNEDEVSSQPGSHATEESSVVGDQERYPETWVVDNLQPEALSRLRKAQFWQKAPSVDGIILETVRKPVTELQATREVLFMLAGLPTSLFGLSSEGSIVPNRKYKFKHASTEAYDAVATTFAEQGTAVSVLRSWTIGPQTIPLLQVLQGCISDRIQSFDRRLSDIQARFLAPPDDVVVSVTSLQAEVGALARPLLRLAKLILHVNGERYAHAFRYLEFLYDETCTSQMVGDDAIYEFMAKLFFQCFQLYLRPIRAWMEEGELIDADTVFFVTEATGSAESASIWQSRFKLRKTQQGVLHAPKFLHTAAHRVFTTGKSVVVLKHLNKFASLDSRQWPEPRLDFQSVCDPSRPSLSSFPELFDRAFDAWIQSKHRQTSDALRKTLFDSCGLRSACDALAHVYFLADGTASAGFTNSVFDKLDILNPSWKDRFTLTELAQNTIGSHSAVSADRLGMAVRPLSRRNEDVARCRRSVKVLSIIELKYFLSWPIQIIIMPLTLSSYQRIFSFLFQVRRASHILTRNRLASDELTMTSGSDERALYYSLRSRLLWFSSTIYCYLTSLVLEPKSRKMREDLKHAEDVDAMIAVHTAYVKTIINEALLGSRLELIYKTVLKILDLSIRLEDAQAANAQAAKESMDKQQEMMDLSLASLGFSAPKAEQRKLKSVRKRSEDVSEDEEADTDVDLSILSGTYEDEEELGYIDALRKMREDFDRLVRFVGSGLRGVARASGGQEAKSWDMLGEMVESGLGGDSFG